MEDIKYYKSTDNLHYYKLMFKTNNILHIMCNDSDQDIQFQDVDESGKIEYYSAIEANAACINTINGSVKEFLKNNRNGDVVVEITRDEFFDAMRVAVFNLDIYEYVK